MKILLISLAGVGDTLMATPLIAELRKNFPNAIIDCLVMWDSSKKVLENNPNLNQIFCFNMIKKGFFKTFLFCKWLKKKKYYVSINTFPQGKIHYRIISKLINSKFRLSHKYNGFLNFLDNFLINKFIKSNYNLHCIENNFNFLKIFNKELKLKKHDYEIYLSKENMNFAKEFIKKNKLSNKKIIGMHIGSGSTKNLALRRWPLENYINLIKKLISDKKTIIFLFGGKDEEKENQQINSINSKRIFIVKSDNIKDSAALIQKCDFFLSVDTALMHIASAMKIKKQLVLETPTFNKTVYPYNQNFINIRNSRIVKDKLKYYKYDGRPIKATKEEIIRIMEGISVEEVYNKIKKVI